MKIEELWLITSILKSCFIAISTAQVNRPPRFSVGGDMAHFSIPENVDIGSTIYKLRGNDPEGSPVHFSISGEFFSVNKYTGDVTLIKELDREANDSVEVIISITDEPVSDAEANTVSIRREIPIIDVNDNPPLFGSSQYSLIVSEATKVGTIVSNNITISDKDYGLNSMVNLFCVQSPACQIFSVTLQIISEGYYKVMITLLKPLNYEVQSSHTFWLKAIDSNTKKPLSTSAEVIIDVEDVQDQPPVFFNTPYSISVEENTPPGQKVLTVSAKDGDVKNLRPVSFSLDEDVLHYFTIQDDGNGNASIITTDKLIDREDPVIVQMGGIYTFYVKATELTVHKLLTDETKELVTVVIVDVNDQLPKFNKLNFNLNITEDIGVGTPVPGLDMIASDDDIGENAQFSLTLRSSDVRFADYFTVEPVSVTRQSPVIVKVLNNSCLDYEAGIRNINLYVVAFVTNIQNEPVEVSSSEINLNVVDVNDNVPQFLQLNYVINVPEDTIPNTRIANITATDRDSGVFSIISYSMGGFGIEKFNTDFEKGGLILSDKLDYEQQTSYSLTLEAKDGGNRTTTANILVNVIDVNDNAPIFEHSEYRRNIREGSSSFQPQFFVKAFDVDGTSNNKVTYTIANSNSDTVIVDKYTGELTMLMPASSQHTSAGQYELKIVAHDSGIPSLSSHCFIFIRVGVPGNQRPLFKGTPYNITIPETLAPNSFITTVRATDPDGLDETLEYKLTGGADNFYIKSRSGMIYLSENADLTITPLSPKKYNITVLAIDSGMPFRETAHTTVTVNVIDVNNKPPVFKKTMNYVAHVSEKIPIGAVIIKVKADDPDENADVRYSLLEPIQGSDRRGFPLKDNLDNYTQLFNVDDKTGEIYVQRSLNNLPLHVITLWIEARDRNAMKNVADQFDRVEVTVFIEAADEIKPVFLIGGWSKSNPVIVHNMPEELPIGSNILTIVAQDPSTSSPVTKFNVKFMPRQLAMDPVGNVVVTERIDYESILKKQLIFIVEAVSNDGKRSTESSVVINIMDVNDHSPQFIYKYYQGAVEENSKKGTLVLVVNATDGDLLSSPQGYGNISYYLTGEHAFLFEIDSVSGEIKVGNNIIDRENQPALNLIAVAKDNPYGGKDTRKSQVPIQIDVLDMNDNVPTFKQKQYTGVILENSKIGASVLNISAVDPDIGSAGVIKYSIIDEFDGSGLFQIIAESGEIVVQKALTGRGRNYPYCLIVRAEDNGNPILFTDVQVNILIGDVVTNDGIPVFIHPNEEEKAFISEDSPIGTLVFQAVAIDPDDPFSPEGQIQYSLLRDSLDTDVFNIDAETGIITNRMKLNREIKSRYTLIILVKDGGVIPQQATRILEVIVNDTDDNIPLFKRDVDDKPLQISVREELPIGTVIGSLEAVDPDEKQNAKIGYLITNGNEDGLFSILEKNDSAFIETAGRIDREKMSQFLLTVKCFKKREKPKMMYKKYNKTDFSERQIYIKVLDIDDNAPEFTERNITAGVRFNAPIDFLLLTLTAYDADAEAGPISYRIVNYSFTPIMSRMEKHLSFLPFTLNNYTGELRTNASIKKFVDGYFCLEVAAHSGYLMNASITIIKIYVVRERALLKFVFSKTPSEVKEYLTRFKAELENAVALPSIKLNVFEIQYHLKEDILDFSKTSSCFQVVGDKFGTKDVEHFFDSENNDQLKELYKKYNVESIEHCGNQLEKPNITWVQISLLCIASFIGITSIISTCILCCSYSRWQRLK